MIAPRDISGKIYDDTAHILESRRVQQTTLLIVHISRWRRSTYSTIFCSTERYNWSSETRIRDKQKCDFYDCHISLHFRMLLQVFFQCLKAPRVLSLEEDLEEVQRYAELVKRGRCCLLHDKAVCVHVTGSTTHALAASTASYVHTLPNCSPWESLYCY